MNTNNTNNRKPQTPENIVRRIVQLGLVQLPDPLPPVPEIARALQARIQQHKIEQTALKRTDPDYPERFAGRKIELSILELKLSELHECFPEAFTKNSAEKTARSESTLPNQPPAKNTEVISGDSLVSSSDSRPTPSDSAPISGDSAASPGESSATKDDNSNEEENEEECADDEAENEDSLEDYFDDEEMEAITDLREHLSGRSPLDQQAIISLLEDHKAETVVAILREPRPQGLDLETSAASINRFRHRYQRAKDKHAEDARRKSIENLLDNSPNPHDAFQNSLERQIKFRLLSEPSQDLPTLDALITTLTKLRKQSLAERKQLHAEQK